MKKTEIKIGKVYAMKVGKNTVGVRIMSQNEDGSWIGTNVNSLKEVVIKSADRLCGQYRPKSGKKTAKAAKKDSVKTSADTTNKAERKLGGLDAAEIILQEAGQPLNCQEIVKRILEKGLWQTEGKTPAATLYSAIFREIRDKGAESRFRKADKGKFELNK
jgi:hypothetical protein